MTAFGHFKVKRLRIKETKKAPRQVGGTPRKYDALGIKEGSQWYQLTRSIWESTIEFNSVSVWVTSTRAILSEKWGPDCRRFKKEWKERKCDSSYKQLFWGVCSNREIKGGALTGGRYEVKRFVFCLRWRNKNVLSLWILIDPCSFH